MFNLNSAFDRLRKKVPTFAYEKRLSRIDTLRLAITYIQFMAELIEDDDAEKCGLKTRRESRVTFPTIGLNPDDSNLAWCDGYGNFNL